MFCLFSIPLSHSPFLPPCCPAPHMCFGASSHSRTLIESPTTKFVFLFLFLLRERVAGEKLLCFFFPPVYSCLSYIFFPVCRCSFVFAPASVAIAEFSSYPLFFSTLQRTSLCLRTFLYSLFTCLLLLFLSRRRRRSIPQRYRETS